MTDAMNNLKTGVTMILMVALIGAALGITLDGFQDDIGESDCTNAAGWWNVTSNVCQDNSSSTNAKSGYANEESYNATLNGLEGLSNATGYLDTIGTLIGVASLVSIVVGAFLFFRRV